MVEIQPNANFHSVTGRTVFDIRKDKKFLEYRRRWYEFPANFIVGTFPIHLDIETTNTCNLRCPFCARTFKNRGSYKKGFMHFSLFKRIIDEGAENGLCSLKLSFHGEPLLHPDITEMVAYAKKRGIIDVYFNTNATRLDENKINQLIDAGLDRISISFEGISKEIYERYRIGAKYELVVQNIKKLRRIRDSRNLRYPQIRIQSVIFPELEKEFSKYVEFWQDIADEIAYIDTRSEKSGDKHRKVIANWACPFLWQRMIILWNGTVLPCPMHGINDFSLMSLGNVKELSIKQMWKGDKFSQYRRLHSLGRAHELEACDRCSYRATELEKIKVKK